MLVMFSYSLSRYSERFVDALCSTASDRGVTCRITGVLAAAGKIVLVKLTSWIVGVGTVGSTHSTNAV